MNETLSLPGQQDPQQLRPFGPAFMLEAAGVGVVFSGLNEQARAGDGAELVPFGAGIAEPYVIPPETEPQRMVKVATTCTRTHMTAQTDNRGNTRFVTDEDPPIVDDQRDA